jgi:hypothetical protein
MAKWFIPSVIGTYAVIYLITIFSTKHQSSYLYNAYSYSYDEYFIIKSHQLLPLDTIVHFNDKSVVTDDNTEYAARIISPYTSIH